MNYTELKADIATWSIRSDLTALLPKFIVLAEARFNKTFRSNEMIARSTLVASSEYTALPADCLELKRVQTTATPICVLRYITPEQMGKEYSGGSGTTYSYTVVGNELQLGAAPGTSLTLAITYYQKIPALSDTNLTNWLLTSHPDIYLYAALIEAARYIRDVESETKWDALYAKAESDLRTLAQRKDFTGATLTIRSDSGV